MKKNLKINFIINAIPRRFAYVNIFTAVCARFFARKFICLSFPLALMIIASMAVQSAYAGSGGAAFLKKGIGARALALGGAYTALADDTSSLYWNPAGLARVQDYSVSLMGTSGSSDEWENLSDMTPSYNFAAFSVPLSRFSNYFKGLVVAVGYFNSTFKNVTKTSEEGISGYFNDVQNALFVSFGAPMWEGNTNLYAGVTFKYISEKMETVDAGSASGYDIDAGLIYNVFDTLNFGVFISNGAAMGWEGNGGTDHSKVTAKFGISNNFSLNKKVKLTPAIDIVQVHQEPLSANFGLEFSYLDAFDSYNLALSGIHVRGGLNSYALEKRYDVSETINENISYCFGFGIDLTVFGKFFQLDYAFAMGNVFDRQSKVSLNFYF
ncbi:MAG: hypothetical protein LBU09_05725 [Endomicrobium sp.]|jgi:hypothetical protein|nr:hypothetical protein [Endomicrobium sp.]